MLPQSCEGLRASLCLGLRTIPVVARAVFVEEPQVQGAAFEPVSKHSCQSPLWEKGSVRTYVAVNTSHVSFRLRGVMPFSW